MYVKVLKRMISLKNYISFALTQFEAKLDMKRLLTLLAIWIVCMPAEAQDIHYTQYNHAPLTLNPAFTGGFYGTFRIGGIYRDQFFNQPDFSNSFSTPNIFIDAPIIKGFRDKDWVGVGVSMFQDQAGALDLTVGSFMGNAAYHLGLGKDGNSTLAIGVQLGYSSRGFQSANMVRFGDQMSQDNVPMDDISYFDMGAGVTYKGLLSANTIFEAGVSAFHLTGPDYAVKGNDKLPRRFVGHARLKNYLTNEFTLTPSLLFMNMNKTTQFSVQTVAGFIFDPVKEIEINAGLGYRINSGFSSLELLGGVDWGDFRASFGYDFGLSSESFGGGQQPGAFELAASYIVKIFKKPEPKPTIFCPRF